jgi:hypothetical protein
VEGKIVEDASTRNVSVFFSKISLPAGCIHLKENLREQVVACAWLSAISLPKNIVGIHEVFSNFTDSQ